MKTSWFALLLITLLGGCDQVSEGVQDVAKKVGQTPAAQNLASTAAGYGRVPAAESGLLCQAKGGDVADFEQCMADSGYKFNPEWTQASQRYCDTQAATPSARAACVDALERADMKGGASASGVPYWKAF